MVTALAKRCRSEENKKVFFKNLAERDASRLYEGWRAQEHPTLAEGRNQKDEEKGSDDNVNPSQS